MRGKLYIFGLVLNLRIPLLWYVVFGLFIPTRDYSPSVCLCLSPRSSSLPYPTLYYVLSLSPPPLLPLAQIQPVLQFGSTPAGGGSYWAVASWYVSSTNSFYTPTFKVDVGDVINGTLYTLNNGSWVCNGTSNASGHSASFVYQPPSSDYTTAYHVLETYGVVNCQVYPATGGQVTFTNITVFADHERVATPNWTTNTKDATCDEHATVDAPDQVSIHYSTTG
jgi:hypothetical protein